MTKVKEAITSIPFIGYFIKLASNILRLPHHLSGLRHTTAKNSQKIKSLEESVYRSNQVIVELIDRVDKIEKIESKNDE